MPPKNTCRDLELQPPVKAHVNKLVTALKECSKAKDLNWGKKLHQEAVSSGVHTNKYVATAMINMYSKCGEMSSARDIFNKLSDRTVVSWTSIIQGYTENGHSISALELFTSMDCTPDHVIFVAALKACACMASDGNVDKDTCIRHGKAIHETVKLCGLETNLAVATTLLDMYCKCGCMKIARTVFDMMPERSVVSWNSLILGYVANGNTREAYELFKRIDCKLNHVSFVAGLKICATLASETDSDKEACIQMGTDLHKRIKELQINSESDTMVVECTLLDMYRKCERIDLARRVFDGMTRRNVVAWTNLVMGYVQCGDSLTALSLFKSIDCEPDYVTYVAALKACAGLARNEPDKQLGLTEGIAIHRQLKQSGLEFGIVLENTLLDMYCKCGSLVRARRVFDSMPLRDVITWNCLMMGYVERGEYFATLSLFSLMDCVPDVSTFVTALKACSALAAGDPTSRKFCSRKGGKIHEQAIKQGLESDILLMNTLLDTYSNCGNMLQAQKVFNGLQRRDVVTWNCLILGYVEKGEALMALKLYVSMDCQPNRTTFIAVLKACSRLACFSSGRLVHAQICRFGLEGDGMVATSLVNFYGKLGSLYAAELVFFEMQTPNLVSWNALLAAYSNAGGVSELFCLTRELLNTGLQPDKITFLGLLMACVHAGKVEEGKRIFHSMQRFGVEPGLDHYTCVANMVGKANRMQDAFSVVSTMPHQADMVLWTTLLGDCRKWNNAQVGKLAFDVSNIN